MSCYGKQIYDCEPNVGEIWLHKSYENEFTNIGGIEYSRGVEILFVWGGCTGPTTVFYRELFTGFNSSASYRRFMETHRFSRKSR
ncbi:hypothetical protein [Faecalibaculum rodentium]|uniref:hypothetical protein n=1 Tax=Faecalibaculum rodentium TaxID=1702221 RepID=UPI0027308B0D|nr:hypothetical protein [Faecalibaculum rodentium]